MQEQELDIESLRDTVFVDAFEESKCVKASDLVSEGPSLILLLGDLVSCRTRQLISMVEKERDTIQSTYGLKMVVVSGNREGAEDFRNRWRGEVWIDPEMVLFPCPGGRVAKTRKIDVWRPSLWMHKCRCKNRRCKHWPRVVLNGIMVVGGDSPTLIYRFTEKFPGAEPNMEELLASCFKVSVETKLRANNRANSSPESESPAPASPPSSPTRLGRSDDEDQ